MLKLMLASDSSAEGIGKVLEGFIRQMHKTNIDFSKQLQVMEGNLGTFCNLESLRALQQPTSHPEEGLGNVFMLLGESHTLWNVSQALLLLHHGNNHNSEDLGAWHTLESLGISANLPVTKKDFTLMISNMQQVHEVTILLYLL
jgi:hypothetical protein